MRSDQIEFFMSCAACLNFSLAAKYHFVSVSTLSRSISALEDELGLKLFNRGYHGHELTLAGKGFFENCMEAYINHEGFIRQWTTKMSDTLVIGCKPYDGSYERLVTAYSRASADNHSLKLKLVLISENALMDCFEKDIIKIAFTDDEVPDYYYSMPLGKIGEREYVFMSKVPLDEADTVRLIKLASFIK